MCNNLVTYFQNQIVITKYIPNRFVVVNQQKFAMEWIKPFRFSSNNLLSFIHSGLPHENSNLSLIMHKKSVNNQYI